MYLVEKELFHEQERNVFVLSVVSKITETVFVADLRQEIDVTKKPSPKEPKSPGFEKPAIIPTESPVDSNKLTEQHNNDFITPSNTPLRQQSKYIKPDSFHFFSTLNNIHGTIQ